MEELLRKIPGVIETEVGYTGGTTANPTYEDVHDGQTGHAEAMRVVFDPSELIYEELLECFFRMHDPTTSTARATTSARSTARRSSTSTDEQRKIAEAVKAARRPVGQVEAPDRHRDRRRRRVRPGRGLPPGLPGEAPGRLHLPLPARLT